MISLVGDSHKMPQTDENVSLSVTGSIADRIHQMVYGSGVRSMVNKGYEQSVEHTVPPSPTTTSLLTIANGRRIAALEDRIGAHEDEIEDLGAQVNLQRLIIGRLMCVCSGLSQRLEAAQTRDQKLLQILKLVTFHLKMIKGNLIVREGARTIISNQILWRMLVMTLLHVSMRLGGVYAAKSVVVKLLARLLLGRVPSRDLVGGAQIATNVALIMGVFYLGKRAIKSN